MNNLKQKSNLLLTAVITAVSFSIALSLVKYFRRGQFNLMEALIGALVFFVVYFFLGNLLNGDCPPEDCEQIHEQIFNLALF